MYDFWRLVRFTMARGCCLCKNNNKRGFTLFGFPKSPQRREQWAKFVKPDWTPKHERLCQAHFKPSDFAEQLQPNSRPLLKNNVVPTVRCNGKGCLSGSQVDHPAEGIILITNSTSTSHETSCSISITEDLITSARARTPHPKMGKECSQVSKENVQLQNSLARMKHNMNCKTKIINKNERCILGLKQKVNKNEEFLKKNFGDDQIKAAETGNSRGRWWTAKSVQKALDVKLGGGRTGLQAASDNVFPLPSDRTLLRRMKPIKFKPGLLYEFLKPLAEKVSSSFTSHERDCTLHFDEMATKTQRSFDMGTGNYFGDVTLKGEKGPSNKLEVWTFAGIQTKWKMNAAYHCTASRGCYEPRAQVTLDLLKYAEDAGLNCIAVVCDMGNRGVLTQLGFNTTKAGKKFSIPHPFNSDKKLYLVPDIVHVFKAVKDMLQNNEVATLSESIALKYSLPSQEVRFQHVEWLVDFQDNMPLKFAPRLSKRDVTKNHFSKMNSASACHIFDDKTGGAIEFLADQKIFEEESRTTAWFINLMNKWFKILSSRSLSLALSLKNMEAYNEAISTIKLVMEVFDTLSAGTQWKPVQTHILVASEALLHIQHYLLSELGYDFLFMGRFLNDVTENIFSDIRKTRPTPTPLQAKYQLRLQTLSQCGRKVLKSQYDKDDRENLLTLEEILSYLKKHGPQNAPKDDEDEVDNIILPWEPVVDRNITEYKFQHLILYRVCGYVIFSMRKNQQLKCDVCYVKLQQIEADHPLREWTKRTNYKSGARKLTFAMLFLIYFN